MSTLLYIEASPRQDDSSSTGVAKRFLDSYNTSRPDDDIDIIKLWETDLPAFDKGAIEAKYARLQDSEPTGRGIEAWQEIEQIVNRFIRADHYLFSVPMWNFSIPYVLKHYIDILVQPGLTFDFTPETGPKGLVQAESVTVVYSSGASYSNAPMDQLDFQKPYLEAILSFIGLDSIQSVVISPTAGTTDETQEAQLLAESKAIELAALLT